MRYIPAVVVATALILGGVAHAQTEAPAAPETAAVTGQTNPVAEVEKQIQTLKRELEAKIKSLREEYKVKMDALRKEAKTKLEQSKKALKEVKKVELDRIQTERKTKVEAARTEAKNAKEKLKQALPPKPATTPTPTQ